MESSNIGSSKDYFERLQKIIEDYKNLKEKSAEDIFCYRNALDNIGRGLEVYEQFYFYDFKRFSEHSNLTITFHPHPRKFLFSNQKFFGDVIYMSTRGNTTYFIYGVDYFVKMILDLIRMNKYRYISLIGSSKGASGALILGKRLKEAVFRNRLKSRVFVTAFSPMIDLVVSEKTPPSCKTLEALSKSNYFFKYFFALGGGGRIDKIFTSKESDFFVVYGEKSIIDKYHCELLRGKVELIKLKGINTHGTAAFFPFEDVNEVYYRKLYDAIVTQQNNDIDMKYLDNQVVMMSFEEFKKAAIKYRELYFKKLFPTAVYDASMKYCDSVKNESIQSKSQELESLKSQLTQTKNQLDFTTKSLKTSQDIINSHNFKKQTLEIKNLESDLKIKELKAKQIEKELGYSYNVLEELDLKKQELIKVKQQLDSTKKQLESKNTGLKSNLNYLIFKGNLSYLSTMTSAKDRIHNHLSYKLGKAMIENSKSILGYIRMPYVLSYIKEQHNKEQKQYQEQIKKNPNLKLPKLESYKDYKEALKEKECFTYKLGEAFIRANTLKSKNNINNNTNNISGGGGRYYQNYTISLPYNLFSTNPLLTSNLQKKCVG